MIGVLIVDDEPYVRQMVTTMVDWGALTMQVTAEAYNGEVALGLLAQPENEISLVITDLKMPVMDGLELIKQASAIKPELQFIVISAYDDFHLVKEAFKLGARDYLLKSEMTGEQLYNVLNNMKNRIAAGAEELNSKGETGGDGQHNRLLRENLLLRFANGNSNVDDLKSLQKLLKIQHGSRIALMMLRFVCLGGAGNETGESFRYLISQRMEQTADPLSHPEQAHFEVAQITPFEYCLLGIYSGSEPASAIMKHLRSPHDYPTPDGYALNIGLSHIATDFALLPRLVYEAKTSLEYCFVEGNGTMIRYDGFIDQNNPLYVDEAKQMETLKKYLSSLSVKGNTAGINEVLLRPGYIHACNITAVKELYMKYHFILTDYAQLNGLGGETRMLLSDFETDLKYRADLDGLNRWLTSVIESVTRSLHGNSIINQVKNYIEKHYREEISLHSVAEAFSLNSSYLSRIFSQKENTSFIEYLCQIRIRKAIELMKTSNLKIYEICENIGYSNPEHFSRTFKKVTGKSPKQFIRSGTAD